MATDDAVCFDFATLIRSIGDQTAAVQKPATTTTTQQQSSSSLSQLGAVKPDESAIKSIANLLKVDLGDKTGIVDDGKDDDLSLLLGGAKEKQSPPPPPKKEKKPTTVIGRSDIASKYAAKLAKKGVHGGMAGIELAKQQVEETMGKGDAAGHLAARKLAASEPVSAGSKWMALTGTGALLKYLSFRSMKIALLPQPSVDIMNTEEGQRMEDFKKQLNEVTFDIVHKDGTMTATDIVKRVLDDFSLDDPKFIMLVSDRDDYLLAAKDAGMVTVRVRPSKNAKRGNVSTNFMISSVPETQDVINQVNGISFNSVLHNR